MTQIGSFQRTRHGYEGRLHTLTLDVQIRLVPAEAGDGENLPDWRIHMSDSEVGPEIGAGWDRIGEKAGPYISLLIDCPALAQPIRANLFKSGEHEGLHHLLWNRPQRRGDRS